MLPGGDLAHYIKVEKDKAKKAELPKTGLTGPAVQFYLASTLLGLEILHAHGFVYRDLKDKNVLLDADGTARLCDFGLVHDLKTGPAQGKVGTKGFWAPEQLVKKEDSAYDGACDLWTLGVCAYHWATAVIPFHAPDGDAVRAPPATRKPLARRPRRHRPGHRIRPRHLEARAPSPTTPGCPLSRLP